MTRTPLIALAAAALIAGCGGSSYGGGGSSNSSSNAATKAPAGNAALATSSSDLGTILVDSQGRTLYMFGADTANKSHCSGACATNWPPATGKAQAGKGVDKAKLRVIAGNQLSYAGHPLYRFAGDGSAGDTKGQGVNAFGGAWHVVAPSGQAVTGAPQSSGGSSRSYGGY